MEKVDFFSFFLFGLFENYVIGTFLRKKCAVSLTNKQNNLCIIIMNSFYFTLFICQTLIGGIAIEHSPKKTAILHPRFTFTIRKETIIMVRFIFRLIR